MLNNKETGKLGEGLARTYLMKNGYCLIETNYNTRYGEIDIIARDGKTVAFIEVKTRRSTSFGYPREAVDKYKQEKIKNMAEYYILVKKLKDTPLRFDVVEVLLDQSNNTRAISIIKNAFQ